MKPVVIQKFEYQTLKVGETGFTKAHFDRLVTYNDLHKSQFFIVGHDRVTFQNFVGVIHIHNLTIEVLPKIDKHYDDKKSMRDMLVKMLHRTGDFPLEKTESALLNKTSGTLFELYLRLFLQEVRSLVAQGLPKHYSLYQANEPFIKGRLLMPEQLKNNLIRKDRNFIEYKRYSVDHKFNHILKRALQIIVDTSVGLETLAADLLAHFDNVSDQAISAGDFRKLRYTRKTECYRSAITLAELIITGFQPDLKHGSLNIVAFLFDMNLLFESYVAAEIRRACRTSQEGLKMKAQVSKIFWRHDDSNSRKMIRPDIVIESPAGTFVLDTKWKVLQDVYSDDGDLKQLYAYSLQFESPHVFLVYPGSDESHQFTHGHFQPTQRGQIHNARHISQWRIPLLNKKGEINRYLGQEVLGYIEAKSMSKRSVNPDCGQRCELAANDTINAFARKWREIISVSYDDIANGDFSEECFSLGFGMDLGESLKKAFPGVNVEKASGFKMVVNSIDDVFFLGTAIFSYWRWLTHWMDWGEIYSDDAKEWFTLVFDRLIEISKESGK